MKTLYLILLLLSTAAIPSNSFTQNKKWNTYKGKSNVRKGDFDKALYHFQKALKKDSIYIKANRGAGRIFLYNYQLFDSATFYLSRVMENQAQDSNYFDIYDWASTLRLSEKPNQAIKYFELFKSEYVDGKNIDQPELTNLVEENIAYCRNASMNMNKPKNEISVNNMDFFINSRESEYTPVFMEDDSSLMFNARYKDLKSEKQFADYQYMENVYYFDLKESVASTFDESLGQGSHHAVVGKNFGSDSIVLFYQNKLWVGTTFQKRLSEQKPLPEILTDFYFQPHGVFSRDQNSFYFSAMKTELDNLDLYVSNKDENGNWSEPKKLEGDINTDKREDSPFLAEGDSVLYFSSKGHNSSGGYDVFKSTLVDGIWSNIEALPYPINSAGDDIYYSLNEDETFGYLSSNRTGGFGLMDIYNVRLVPVPTFDCPNFENPDLIVELDISESVDSNSVELAYEWFFEDGEVVKGLKQTKRFRSPGNHTVRIDITDISAGQVEKSEVVEEVLIDSVDYIGFKSNVNYLVGDTAILDAGVSYLENVQFTNYFWSLDDSIIKLDNPVYELPLTKDGIHIIGLQLFGYDNVESNSWCHYDTIYIRNKEDIVALDTNVFVDNNGNPDKQNGNNPDKDTTGNTSTFVDKDSVNAIINSGTLVADLDINPIYFGFDKWNLSNKSIQELNQLVDYLGKYPSAKIIIEGHTDAMGSEEYNKILAQKRITAAVNYLKNKGITNKRIIKTVNEGESNPAKPNTLANGEDNFQGRKLNRRVEFKAVKK